MLDIEWPEDVGSALLVGRVGLLMADDHDEDRHPNIKAAVEGEVTITPEVGEVKYNGQDGTMLLFPTPTKGIINNEGFLFTKDKDGKAGEPGIVVPATSTPVIQPYGYSYHIHIKVPGHTPLEFSIKVSPDEVLDLVKATPVGTIPGTVRIVDHQTAIRAETAARAAESAQGGVELSVRTIGEYAANAKTSETNSKSSEESAETSARSSATSATESKESATKSEKSNQDARDAWSEIMDTVSRGGSFFIQDDPPSPGSTYSWDGERRKSTSTKRFNGATVAYNLVRSPRVIASPMTFAGMNTTTLPHHLGNEIEILSGTSNPWVNYIDEFVSASGYLSSGFNFEWGEGIDTIYLYIRFFKEDGSLASNTYKEITKDDTPHGGRITYVQPIPQDSVRVISLAVFLNSTQTNNRPLLGDTLRLGRFSGAIAATEEEALQHIDTFFDGDTPDEVEDLVWINRDLELRYWVDGQWQLT